MQGRFQQDAPLSFPGPCHEDPVSETGSGQGTRERAPRARITAGRTLRGLEPQTLGSGNQLFLRLGCAVLGCVSSWDLPGMSWLVS